ncbi:MAG: DUF3667 domain-containing protein [Saprospirales bacterium]|nr:MAG: DUF3667 domain-containing protein [Saprospirales bacterium]
MEANDHIKKCPNCNSDNPERAQFCQNCGQKFEILKMRFLPMIGIFLYSLFNADSTLWRTLKHLWIPGKLTKAFFSGERKSYLHPARLFLFSWVLFFAIFTLGDSNIFESEGEYNLIDAHKKRMENREFVIGLLSMRDSLQLADSAIAKMFDHQIAILASSRFDRLETDNIDSVIAFLPTTRNDFKFTILPGHEINVDMDDLVNLDDAELMEKYQINGFFKRLMAGQALKMTRETNFMINYLARGISWMVFFLIPSIAFVLYLLYVYRSHYYVEHLVFTLHCHSFFFVGTILIWLLNYFINFIPSLSGDTWLDLDFLYLILGILGVIYFIVGLKVYYKSRWYGILLKSWILITAYTLFAMGSLILALVIRFLVF